MAASAPSSISRVRPDARGRHAESRIDERPPVYDAFISYSHAKDKPVAAALQSVVQRLGKPWYRRRALRVFRDDTSLSATPSLWPSIERALGQSRFLILLASPEAAASRWVNREIAYWLEHKSIDTLLIALTDGKLAWDETNGDFDGRLGVPLPPALLGRFSTEPKWVNLTAHRDRAPLRDAKFTELAADFAAAIHGMPKEDLLSQEVRQQRRALTLAWSAIGLLLILAGAAAWQWNVAIEQRNIAQAQRDRAERTLAAATQTASTLVFDLAREFRDRTGVPIDLVRKILDRAQELHRQLVESGETAPELLRTEAITLTELVVTLLSLGDTQRALTFAERARAVMAELVAGNPDNRGWQRDLSVSHDKVGDVLLTIGRREEALAEYRKGLAIREKLAAADPDNTLLQRDLSVSHGKIGDVLLVAGQREQAYAEYRKSLEIIEKLAAGDPDNTQWQRDLWIGHSKIGDALIAEGRREEALAEYRAGLEILKKLAHGDPGNAELQRDLSIGHDRIGDLLASAGRGEEALAEYRMALDIIEKLARADPGNAQWQRDRSVTRSKIGEILLAAGRWDEALAEFRGALVIIERLATADPGNTQLQLDLSIGFDRVGRVLAAKGQHDEALAEYRKSLAIRERLAASDPGNTEWQRNLSISHDRIGDLMVVTGRTEQARAEYHKSLEIREKLAAIDPGNTTWQLDLVISLVRLAFNGDQPRARLQRALEIMRGLDSNGRLTEAQRGWIAIIEQALAKLPA